MKDIYKYISNQGFSLLDILLPDTKADSAEEHPPALHR